MPAQHAAQQKLPAVSGSSGRLVVNQPQAEQDEKDWPGRVFEDEKRDYAEAMQAFVAASQAQSPPASLDMPTESLGEVSLAAQKRALHKEEEELRAERRVVRQQRKAEDAAWKRLRAEEKHKQEAAQSQSAVEREIHKEHRRVVWQQRQETVTCRQQEDVAWRQKRNALRQQMLQLPLVTVWIAILVVTDNCTRQCLGLPLFVAGPRVTAEMVIEALRVLLPPELQFVISDRGQHFTAKMFEELARSEGFVHVVIARHRPQSNGIAERFVRTLKTWLRSQTWSNDEELAVLVAQFLAEYNDRPHQGLLLPGLSPNEFANRIWLM